MGQLVEVVLYTFYLHHHLTIVIDSQCLVFQTLGSNLDLRQLTYLGQDGVVGRCTLAFDGDDLQLWVHLGEEGCHEVVEPIEHRQRYHQGHRGNGYSDNGNAADDVNGVS